MSKARLLFRDEYHTAYIKPLVSDPRFGDHYEVIRIDEKSKMCRLYVSKLYYDHSGGGILNSDDFGGGSEKAASTKPPPSTSTKRADEGGNSNSNNDCSGGSGGGSESSTSTENPENHAQNEDGGGSGGSGGTLGEKNILCSDVVFTSESVVTSNQVSPIDLEIAKMRDMPTLKCPYPKCSFKNIHQESVDHHIKHKHGGEEEEKQ